MSLLDDVRAYLINQGVVEGSTGWPCYVGFMPNDQDHTVGLFDTGGGPRDTLGAENRRLTFQTRVRGAAWEYTACRAQWQVIFNALQDAAATGGSPLLLPKVVFLQAVQVGPLAFNDDLHRPNMTTNWRALVLA